MTDDCDDLSTLLSQLPGTRPSHKYCLLRMISLIGIFGHLEGSSETLARRIGVAKGTFLSASLALVKARYLVRETSSGGERAGYLYRKGRKISSKQFVVPDSSWQIGLARFVLHSETMKKTGVLSTTDRMIIALLVCSADNCGVVDDLSRTEIAKLLGLKRGTVKARMNYFLQLGIIRRTIPGCKGLRMFGTVKSIHVMNLNHPLYADNGLTNTVVANYGYWYPVSLNAHRARPESGNASQDIGVSLALLGKRHAKRINAGLPLGPVIKAYERLGPQVAMREKKFFSWVVSFFHEQTLFLGALLQTRIEGYASYILTNYWRELLDDTCVRSTVLERKIKEHVSAAHRSIDDWPSRKASLKLSYLVHFLLQVSWLLARRYQKLIMYSCPDQDWNGVRFLIMPTEGVASNPRSYFSGARKNDAHSDSDSTGLASTPSSADSARPLTRFPNARLSASVLCFHRSEPAAGHSYLQDHFFGTGLRTVTCEWEIGLDELFRNGLLSVNQLDPGACYLKVEALDELTKLKPILR